MDVFDGRGWKYWKAQMLKKNFTQNVSLFYKKTKIYQILFEVFHLKPLK